MVLTKTIKILMIAMIMICGVEASTSVGTKKLTSRITTGQSVSLIGENGLIGEGGKVVTGI